MEDVRFDSLVRQLGTGLGRRSLLGASVGVALGAATRSEESKAAGKKGKKRRFCLNGKTVKARNKKKKRRLHKQGAVRGRCQGCTPECPPTGCGADDGCGGVCECPSGSICANGACETCNVACGNDPVACGANLNTQLAAGGTVYVCPGEFAGQFLLSTSAQVYGAGDSDDAATNTILNGNGTGTTLTVSGLGSIVELNGLRITGGDAPSGFGGGISQNAGSELTITDCTIAENSAQTAGGINSEGLLTLIRTQVTGNTTTGAGGGLALFPASPLNYVITDCVISGNTAVAGGGGGIYANTTNATITGTEIRDNTGFDGGGIFLTAVGSAAFTIDGASSITNNTATFVSAQGGGLVADGPSTITVAPGATISGNSAPQCGGSVTGCP